jgi:hypothetical protein
MSVRTIIEEWQFYGRAKLFVETTMSTGNKIPPSSQEQVGGSIEHWQCGAIWAGQSVMKRRCESAFAKFAFGLC